MTQFGGSFIPVHFVGMLVEGAVPAGARRSELTPAIEPSARRGPGPARAG